MYMIARFMSFYKPGVTYTKDTLGWVEFPAEFSEAVEGFFQVNNELILGLGFNDNIVDISFNIAM